MPYFKSLSVIFAILASTPASAENWIKISESETKASYYLDIDTIKFDGEERIFWIMSEHSRDSSVSYRTSKNRYSIYCNDDTLALLNNINYNSRGVVVNSYSAKSYDIDYIAIAPGTIGDSFRKIVCDILEYDSVTGKPKIKLMESQQ